MPYESLATKTLHLLSARDNVRVAFRSFLREFKDTRWASPGDGITFLRRAVLPTLDFSDAQSLSRQIASAADTGFPNRKKIAILSSFTGDQLATFVTFPFRNGDRLRGVAGRVWDIPARDSESGIRALRVRSKHRLHRLFATRCCDEDRRFNSKQRIAEKV